MRRKKTDKKNVFFLRELGEKLRESLQVIKTIGCNEI
jgi:hypothetical protein